MGVRAVGTSNEASLENCLPDPGTKFIKRVAQSLWQQTTGHKR